MRKSKGGCQCCQSRVAFADTHGSADLLGDDHAPEVVNTPHDSCCFHRFLLYIRMYLYCLHLREDYARKSAARCLICVLQRNERKRSPRDAGVFSHFAAVR